MVRDGPERDRHQNEDEKHFVTEEDFQVFSVVVLAILAIIAFTS